MRHREPEAKQSQTYLAIEIASPLSGFAMTCIVIPFDRAALKVLTIKRHVLTICWR